MTACRWRRKLGTFWLVEGVLEILDTPPESRAADHGDLLPGEDRPLPREDAAAAERVARAKLDSHYHRVLDTPLPFLAGRTPREAAKGKGKVRQGAIDWVKLVENTEGRLLWEQGLEPYDTGWIRKELKLEPPG